VLETVAMGVRRRRNAHHRGHLHRPPTAAWPITPSAAAAPTGYAQVRAVIDQRCLACHNAQIAQKNVALGDAEGVKRHAQAIHQQVVVLRQMPMNNATQITEEERDLIRRWFEAGAPVQ
jgi:uncharacterized membrane protein